MGMQVINHFLAGRSAATIAVEAKGHCVELFVERQLTSLSATEVDRLIAALQDAKRTQQAAHVARPQASSPALLAA